MAKVRTNMIRKGGARNLQPVEDRDRHVDDPLEPVGQRDDLEIESDEADDLGVVRENSCDHRPQQRQNAEQQDSKIDRRLPGKDHGFVDTVVVSGTEILGNERRDRNGNGKDSDQRKCLDPAGNAKGRNRLGSVTSQQERDEHAGRGNEDLHGNRRDGETHDFSEPG